MTLQKEYPFICSIEDASFIDKSCHSDWSSAKHWAQWWTRSTHLKMLSCVFSYVPETWRNCPSTTNAVEQNYESKTGYPKPLKLAMMNLYKLDKSTCYKHMAAENGASISYRSKDEKSHKQSAECRRRQRAMAFTADRMSQHGPPDCCSNFRSGIESQKRNNEVSSKSPVRMSKLSVDNTTLKLLYQTLILE